MIALITKVDLVVEAKDILDGLEQERADFDRVRAKRIVDEYNQLREDLKSNLPQHAYKDISNYGRNTVVDSWRWLRTARSFCT